MSTRAVALIVFLLPVASACGHQPPTGPTPTANVVVQQTRDDPFPPVPPTGGATSIEGAYRLTVTASPACSLPAEVMQRTYTATIAEREPGHVTVSLTGAEFWLQEWNAAGFEGTRDGDRVRFLFDTTYGPGYYFIERIDNTNNLIYEGDAYATIGDESIVGTFNGEIRYVVPGQKPWLGDCTAPDHRISLTR